jgi:hypothetical protein
VVSEYIRGSWGVGLLTLSRGHIVTPGVFILSNGPCVQIAKEVY